MKLLDPLFLGGAGLAVVGFAVSTPVVVAIGILLMLVSGFFQTIGSTRQRALDDPTEDLSPESRVLIRPVRKLLQEMEEVATRNKGEVSPYIANEGLDEAKRLVAHSAAALKIRDRLTRERRGEYEATKGIAELEQRLAAATTDEERQSLQSAMEARRQELAHYSGIDASVSRIDSSVRQAEAVLAEMKARLASSAVGGLASQGSDDLREAVGRMKVLSASLEEAQDLAST